MAAEVQSPGLLIACWVIAGVVTLFGALSNAEVAGIMEPGGFYQFFKKMYGRGFAFLYGWSSFTIIQTASMHSFDRLCVWRVGKFVVLICAFRRLTNNGRYLGCFNRSTTWA